MHYNPSDPDGYIANAPGEIPVTFEWQGKEYKGVLSYARGMGQHIWFLKVNNFYWGQLFQVTVGVPGQPVDLKAKVVEWEWSFCAQKEDMRSYSDEFGAVVVAWYQ